MFVWGWIETGLLGKTLQWACGLLLGRQDETRHARTIADMPHYMMTTVIVTTRSGVGYNIDVIHITVSQ